MKEKIVVRIPPSPTGYFHVGRARTALFNYLFAKKNGGKIVFRFEDTDKERSKKEFEEDILESLKWMGITYDEGPFYQSKRAGMCRKHIENMLKTGHAYISKETEGKNTEVIRFKNPNKKILFNDLIRGHVEFNTEELGDFIIARNINDPLYHLAVVVDDFDMGITHIIRGDDGISNTPRQILIQEAIGAPRPQYAHVPLILAPDRSKLSGRHGAVSIRDYRGMGYLPEALVNYLALLGWNPGTEQEIFTMDELIKAFDISKIQKGGAIFDKEKLDWINKEHIKLLPQDEQDARTKKAVLDEFGSAPKIEKQNLICPEKLRKGTEVSYSDIVEHLGVLIDKLEKIDEKNWKEENIKSALWNYATENGRGIVLWAMRYALSGKERSPDPFVIAGIIGKSETLSRLRNASEI